MNLLLFLAHGSGTRTELAGGGARGGVDWSRSSPCLDAAEDRLAAMSAVSPAAGCLWSLLPIVVESNQLPLKSNKRDLVKKKKKL